MRYSSPNTIHPALHTHTQFTQPCIPTPPPPPPPPVASQSSSLDAGRSADRESRGWIVIWARRPSQYTFIPDSSYTSHTHTHTHTHAHTHLLRIRFCSEMGQKTFVVDSVGSAHGIVLSLPLSLPVPSSSYLLSVLPLLLSPSKAQTFNLLILDVTVSKEVRLTSTTIVSPHQSFGRHSLMHLLVVFPQGQILCQGKHTVSFWFPGRVVQLSFQGQFDTHLDTWAQKLCSNDISSLKPQSHLPPRGHVGLRPWS